MKGKEENQKFLEKKIPIYEQNLNDELYQNSKTYPEYMFKGEHEEYTDRYLKKSVYELNDEDEEHLDHNEKKERKDYKDYEK